MSADDDAVTMNRSGMRRGAITLLAGVVLASGATYALAAGSSITASTLGAGSSVVSSCQTAPLRTTFGFAPQGELLVTVDALDTSPDACGGKRLAVTLHGTAHGDHEELATVPDSGSSVTLHFAGVDVRDVTSLSVALAG